MIRILIISTAGVLTAVLQSTLLSGVIPFGIVPDPALIILTACAWKEGSLTGEIAGFLIGISLDALSLAPFGFHALLFTLIGYLFGKLQGNIAFGAVLFPLAGTAAATLMKYGGAFLLSLVFGPGTRRIMTIETLWELLANMILAPALFFLAGRILTDRRKGGFG